MLKALESENVAFCNIDQTRLGETLEGTDYVTAPLAYLRLHGRSKNWFSAKHRDERYNYLYSKGSLEKIKTKVQSMAAKAEKTFVAANNHPKGQAAANAIELKRLFSGEIVKAPEPLLKTYPELEEFAIPGDLNQGSTPKKLGDSIRQNDATKNTKEDAIQQDLPL